MAFKHLDQLTTETVALSSDKLLGIRGTGIGSELLFTIDGIPNKVMSVAGRIGNITLSASDVSGIVSDVNSVNGKTGVVVLSASDIPGLVGGVSSVNSKNGAVMLSASDIYGITTFGQTFINLSDVTAARANLVQDYSVNSESCAFFGDSLTFNNPAYPNRNANVDATNSWAYWFCFLSSGRYYMQNNAGVAGDTTAMMVARISAVTTRPAKTTFLFAGTNDNTTGISPLSTLANLDSIITSIKSVGSNVVMFTIQGNSGSYLNNLDILNWGIIELGRSKGCQVIDLAGFLTDPHTRQLISTYNYDGVHFTAAGSKAVAIYVLKSLGYTPITAKTSILPRATIDYVNMVADPLFQSVSATTVFSNATAVDISTEIGPVIGNSIVFEKTSTDTIGAFISLKNTSVSPGNRIRFAGRVSTFDIVTGNGLYYVYLSWTGASADYNAAPLYSWAEDINEPFVFSQEVVVPISATNVDVVILFSGLGTLKLSELALYNIG